MVITVLIILAIYFIPSIIAIKRKHSSKGGIIALNIFLGWTFLGWIGSLVWSLAKAN